VLSISTFESNRSVQLVVPFLHSPSLLLGSASLLFYVEYYLKVLNAVFYHSVLGILVQRNHEDDVEWLERLIKCLAGG
jgi:hypothetical protein